jgi:hypothetical protein
MVAVTAAVAAGRTSEMNIKKRGFGSMDKDRQREIASRGGRKAHEGGKAHRWTSDTAKDAASKSAHVRNAASSKKAE